MLSSAESYLKKMTINGIKVEAASTPIHGQINVPIAGTAAILGPSTVLKAGVRIKAKNGNTGYIYVGHGHVTATNGYILVASEEIFVETDNIANISINASVNNDGVSYIGS